MARLVMAGRALMIAGLTLYVLLLAIDLAKIHIPGFIWLNVFVAAGLLGTAGMVIAYIAKQKR